MKYYQELPGLQRHNKLGNPHIRIQEALLSIGLMIVLSGALVGFRGLHSITAAQMTAASQTATAIPTPQIRFISAPTSSRQATGPVTETATPTPHLAAQRALPGVLIGANVDMGEILPSSPHYITTTQGDLFDIAHRAGLNTFRVTSFEAWGPGQKDTPYTAADWKAIAVRATATHIWLEPQLELGHGLVAQAARTQGLSRYDAVASVFISESDMILGQAGLARNHNIAMIDIGNELGLSPDVLGVLRKVADHIHTTYPTVPVTVGGWRAPLNALTASAADYGFGPAPLHGWVYNYPSDGKPLLGIVDVMSVHIYDRPLPNHQVRKLFLDMPTVISQGVLDYLKDVQAWSGNLPIVIEEFGAPTGFMATPRIPQGVTVTPESHATVVKAILQGAVMARQQKVNVNGALIWLLAPRGGSLTANPGPNALAIIVPQGAGQPLKIGPAFGVLCSSFQGALTHHCPVTSSTPQPTQTGPTAS